MGSSPTSSARKKAYGRMPQEKKDPRRCTFESGVVGVPKYVDNESTASNKLQTNKRFYASTEHYSCLSNRTKTPDSTATACCRRMHRFRRGEQTQIRVPCQVERAATHTKLYGSHHQADKRAQFCSEWSDHFRCIERRFADQFPVWRNQTSTRTVGKN